MIRNITFLLALSASVCNSLKVNSQNSTQNQPADDNGELISISLPGYNWVEIYYSEFEATSYSAATSFSQARCDISYKNTGYKKKSVNVAAYIAYTDENGKVNEDAVTAEQELEGPQGTLHVFFVKQNLRLEGIAEMNIYLTDKKNNIISNVLTIPVAAGAEAVRLLQEQLGPSEFEIVE
jgi:hypothetical protein